MTFRRLTGSELFFSILDELIKLARTVNENSFVRSFLELSEKVLMERPASAAVINALRNVAERILERGISDLAEYINKLRVEYDNALWKSAEVAARRVNRGDRIFTNSNSLAIRRFLKVLRDRGVNVEVFIAESRPGEEGLLMAEYVESLGFTAYLLTDSATRFFIKDVDKVFVGAEAIAANGAVVSKVGTSIVALVAKEARKRVFVVAPTMKFSYESIHGELLKIPEGGPELLARHAEVVPRDFAARVPLYDVTPAEYVDAVATEYGIVAPQAVPILLKALYGTYPPEIMHLDNLLVELRRKYGG